MTRSSLCLLLFPALAVALPSFGREPGFGMMMDPGAGGMYGGGMADPFSPFNNRVQQDRVIPQQRSDYAYGYPQQYQYSPSQYNPTPMHNPGFGFGYPQSGFGNMFGPAARFGGSEFPGSENLMGNGMGMDMGGDAEGMSDMFRMQEEMAQLQKQLMQSPPTAQSSAAATDKGNSSTKVTKIGDSLLLTNQTRFTDNSNGLTQGFFQEFQILPGMDATTPSGLARSGGVPAASIQGPSGFHNAGAKPNLTPEAIFGFAPQNTFNDPGKLGDVPPAAAIDHMAPVVPANVQPSSLGGNDISAIKAGWNGMQAGLNKMSKKDFSTEKLDSLGDSFSRTF